MIWCGTVALAIAEPTLPVAPPDPDDAAYPAIQRFVEVLEAVRKRHPDVDRLAYERLVNHALEGMLAGLDPHSSFIHPEMAARMKETPDMNPEIASLGLTVGLRDDGPYIAAVAPQGPAASAGVLLGSALLEIDGNKVDATGFNDWSQALQKVAGSVTRMKVKSPASPRAEELTMNHRVVEERSVVEARLWDKDKGTGYVRLASFGNWCSREMEAALDELEDSEMKSLALDLRQNGGGDLGETVRMLGLWLPTETAVVSTRGRDEKSVEELKTPDRQRRKRHYPIVVLIDRMSASASELAAGALQDLKRAAVIGELSYGKGSVQNIIPMGGATALRLTIATYHTPSGKTPHGKGITPDVAVEMNETDREIFLKRCHLDALPPEQKRQSIRGGIL